MYIFKTYDYQKFKRKPQLQLIIPFYAFSLVRNEARGFW